MSSPTKRLLLIIGLLLAALLIGLALYFMYRATTTPIGYRPIPTEGELAPGQLPQAGERMATTAPTEEQMPGGLPSAGVTGQRVYPSYSKPAAVNQISSEYALYPSLSRGGNFRYHNAADGKFYRILPNGDVRALSDEIFYNVSNVTWARSRDQAVLEYPDGSKIIYNFETKTQVTLPRHWKDFSFSAEGNELAAKSIGVDPDNRWLVATKDDGTGTRLIEPLGENEDKVEVNWSPARQTVAFAQTGEAQGAYRKEILFLGLQGENLKSMTVEGLGFIPEWAPTGKRLLYSVYSSRSDYKPELWIADAYGDNIGANRQLISLNTWADKCSFSNDSLLFCAVPQNLEKGAGMRRDIADQTPDDLYRIDIRTGLKTPINLGGEYTIKDIYYDSIRNRVVFTDRNRNGVFEAPL